MRKWTEKEWARWREKRDRDQLVNLYFYAPAALKDSIKRQLVAIGAWREVEREERRRSR